MLTINPNRMWRNRKYRSGHKHVWTLSLDEKRRFTGLKVCSVCGNKKPIRNFIEAAKSWSKKK
jgi:hypothetical protein